MLEAEARQDVLSVLLVEDNPADVRMIREALRGCEIEHELYVAPDVDYALAFLRDHPDPENAPRPHLVLLDLMLPGDGGFVLLEKMKLDRDLVDIPVVVLTGSNLEKDRGQSFRLQAECYITKPLGLGAYVKELKFALGFAGRSVAPAKADVSFDQRKA